MRWGWLWVCCLIVTAEMDIVTCISTEIFLSWHLLLFDKYMHIFIYSQEKYTSATYFGKNI